MEKSEVDKGNLDLALVVWYGRLHVVNYFAGRSKVEDSRMQAFVDSTAPFAVELVLEYVEFLLQVF